ncbi:hypothetical protein RJ641_004587 [Dillenia turbinata]|uniref:Uncharacterized protein n=1 Tax=Dillenia turbinata TaxID=194707 RepID=A0AAN8VMP6_9MAGN
MILETRDSGVPRACKDLFWDMSQVLHLFYSTAKNLASRSSFLQLCLFCLKYDSYNTSMANLEIRYSTGNG